MARMEAQQKLEFYATDFVETLKILLVIGRFKIREKYERDENVLACRDIWFKDSSTRLSLPEYLFQYLLENERYEETWKYLELDLRKRNIVVADFFAGEGAWLEIFKRFAGDKVITVANELEEGRAKMCEQSQLIDYAYQGPYEELSFPKATVDVMLLNPPYDTVNKVNLCEFYFNDIVKKDYIAQSGLVVMVMSKKDLSKCASTLIKHFYVKECYKVAEEEFSKWGQYVVVAIKRLHPLDGTRYYVQLLHDELQEFEERMLNADHNLPSLGGSYLNMLRGCDLQAVLATIKLNQDIPCKLSTSTSTLWKKYMDMTSVKKTEQAVLVTPKKPKGGELSQIIAAGYINGKVMNHIVVGGVKKVETTVASTDDKGKEMVSKLRSSVPYLNILHKKDGRITITELLTANAAVIEDDELVNVQGEESNNE